MKRQTGLTFLEVVIALSLLGLLLAVAIPTFAKHMRRSKTAEATETLAYMYRAAATYYASERVDPGMANRVLVRCVPASSKTLPRVPKPHRQRVDFSADPTYAQIDFSSGEPVRYAYTFVGVDRCGLRAAPAFTARAEGDLDGDANTSLFERAAKATNEAEIEGQGGLYVWSKNE